ncbi:MAG: universal stress protein [Verrucomicrobiales bacterium]|nr:universal stress protein [Verrucomicrobiales bacterium]
MFAPNREHFDDPGDLSHDVDEYLASLVEKFDEWIKEDLSDLPNLDASFTIRQKVDPHEGILTYASEIGADLIVVGDR